MRAINKHEKHLFDCIRQPNGDHLALVSTEINGIETACISWIAPDGKDFTIQPLAVLVNEDVFPLLKNP